MKTILKLTLTALAVMSFSACGKCDKPKFNAKEYAERKVERLDNIVELTDAQEKEIYNIYLAQGKEIKKNLKNAKKECCDVKCPDSKQAECAKPCDKPACDKKCDKACDKPCDKKAECKKECAAKPCDKPACEKKCDKACDKPCEKKAECKKECAKPCDKPACEKKCDKKAACDKKEFKGKRPHHHNFVNPEQRKATFGKVRAVLTEEQNAKLKEHFAQRRHRDHRTNKCVPSPNVKAEGAEQK